MTSNNPAQTAWLEEQTREAVADLVAELTTASTPVAILYRHDDELHADQPGTDRDLTATWWAQVVARAVEQVPGTVTGTGPRLVRAGHLRMEYYLASTRDGLYADRCLSGPNIFSLVQCTTDTAGPELVNIASDPAGVPEAPFYPTPVTIAYTHNRARHHLTRWARGTWVPRD